MAMFEVIVGNVGTIYSGDSAIDAAKAYGDYVALSKDNYGRVAGESVTLMKNDEPAQEYIGTVDQEPSELAKGMKDLKGVIDRLLGDAAPERKALNPSIDELYEELKDIECEECNHPLRLHADRYGCQFEGPDQFVEGESMGAWMSRGPCGCMAHREFWHSKIEAKLKQGSK